MGTDLKKVNNKNIAAERHTSTALQTDEVDVQAMIQ
jgi:hypothetical protein